MPDPLSITALVLQVGGILEQLYDYGICVKGAQKEISALRGELYALKGVLGDVDESQNTGGAKPMRRELTETLATAHLLLTDLAKKLLPRTSAAIQNLAWPLKSWFMLYLLGDQHTAISALTADVSELNKTIKLDIEDRRRYALTQAQQKLLQAIAPVSPDETHCRACSAWRGSKPGHWFLDGDLKPWLSSGSVKCMALMGRSGSGKTTLILRAIEGACRLRKLGRAIVTAKFYCSYNDAASQEVKNVLGSWISQIISVVPDIINKLDMTETSGGSITIEKLEACLVEAAEGQIDTLLLVVDAINESIEQSELYASIARLTSSSTRIKCLMSTTPRTTCPGLECQSIQMVDMACSELTSDMEEFIDRSIAKSGVLQSIPRTRLLGSLLRNTDGMFRWLECQLQYLSEQPTTRLAFYEL
ncbi:hypothetical protein LTR86_004316 [Recurvomyces mirabilis]|nr:hypothetical protein LTR86_004316 [Recurvomyces mirabilis]